MIIHPAAGVMSDTAAWGPAYMSQAEVSNALQHYAEKMMILTIRTVPEPVSEVMSQLHSPKHGWAQSFAARAAMGRRAAIRSGVNTMASRLVQRRKRREKGGALEKERERRTKENHQDS